MFNVSNTKKENLLRPLLAFELAVCDLKPPCEVSMSLSHNHLKYNTCQHPIMPPTLVLPTIYPGVFACVLSLPPTHSHSRAPTTHLPIPTVPTTRGSWLTWNHWCLFSDSISSLYKPSFYSTPYTKPSIFPQCSHTDRPRRVYHQPHPWLIMLSVHWEV